MGKLVGSLVHLLKTTCRVMNKLSMNKVLRENPLSCKSNNKNIVQVTIPYLTHMMFV